MNHETVQKGLLVFSMMLIGMAMGLLLATTLKKPTKIERELVPGALYPHHVTNYITNIDITYWEKPE